jgi:hypothetical protein
LLVVVGVNCDDELPLVAYVGFNSGIEAERLFVRESESGKKLD